MCIRDSFANGVKLTTVAIPDTKGIAPQATKLVKSEALKSAIEKAEAEHATEEITINFAFASDGSQPLVDKGQVMARQQIEMCIRDRSRGLTRSATLTQTSRISSLLIGRLSIKTLIIFPISACLLYTSDT